MMIMSIIRPLGYAENLDRKHENLDPTFIRWVSDWYGGQQEPTGPGHFDFFFVDS